jgi:hypothetical protein
MRPIGAVQVYLHSFFFSALDGGERLSSRPGRFIPGETVRRVLWIGCVGIRTGLHFGLDVKFNLVLT